MKKDDGGTQMLVRSMGKQLRQMESQIDSALSNCKVLSKLLRDPALHLNEAQKIAIRMLKSAQQTDKKIGKMYGSIRAATQKMPQEDRQRTRKAFETTFAKMDKKTAMLTKAAAQLYGSVDKVKKETPPAGMPTNAFLVLLQILHALVVFYKGWQKMRKTEVG